MAITVLVLFYVFFPFLILHFCHKLPFLNKIGAVVIAYIAGFILGNTGILQLVDGYKNLQELLTSVTIPIAIPLMLFSMDIKKWVRVAGKTLLSMLFALIAVLITVIAGFYIFRRQGIQDLWDVSGMLVGLYTGSTANLAAIKIALGADETNFMIVAAYDLLVGAFHLLFVLTIAQRLFLTFLQPYKFIDPAAARLRESEAEEPYMGLMKKRIWPPLIKAFAAALVIFGIGASMTLIIPKSSQMAVVILLITTLGIVASLIRPINKIEKTFEFGMYFILIFCLVIASMANLKEFDFRSVMIGAYVAFVVFGSMLVQAILSRFFKIDADTFLITSTAFISNAGVVPVVAGALKNREIIVSGITVGIIGIAIGNYMGVFMSWLLQQL
jgi:uncharacterized membrane protein